MNQPIQVPPSPGTVPQAWTIWIETVRPLVADLPTPTVSMIRTDGKYGPPTVWMDWLREAAKRVPHIPPPEEIPEKSKILLYLVLGLLGVLILKRR